MIGLSNDLQSRLGEGVSMLKGGIEQRKQKLQNVQELNRLKRSVEENSIKKSQILLELGRLTYRKIREGQINDPDLVKQSSNLVSLDKLMYVDGKSILEFSKTESDQVVCPSCNAANGKDDRFCGRCGLKLEPPKEVDVSNMTSCNQCEELVPGGAKYCPCCGSKTS